MIITSVMTSITTRDLWIIISKMMTHLMMKETHMIMKEKINGGILKTKTVKTKSPTMIHTINSTT